MKKRIVSWLSGVFTTGLLVALLTPPAWASGVVDPLNRPAAIAVAPARAVLLDVTKAGERLVAVGERGLIVLSDDGGQHWRQAQKVPTSVSLTAVAFPTPTEGWAVGHAGVILHTENGGETWVFQLDGSAAARLALTAAQENVEKAESENNFFQQQLEAARMLVDDGPDKPFLDLAFLDEHSGFVVGAYGLMFRTQDGGHTWQPWMDRLDNPWGLHIYAIRIVGENVYLAGEQGLFLRSTDAGERFNRLDTPYEGTFFAVTASEAGDVLLAGLRGNIYRSSDQGETFEPVAAPLPISFSAVEQGEDGTLYFANHAGFLLRSHDQGRTLTPLDAPRLPPIAALESIGRTGLLTVGFGGAIPVSLEANGAEGGQP